MSTWVSLSVTGTARVWNAGSEEGALSFPSRLIESYICGIAIERFGIECCAFDLESNIQVGQNPLGKDGLGDHTAATLIYLALIGSQIFDDALDYSHPCFQIQHRCRRTMTTGSLEDVMDGCAPCWEFSPVWALSTGPSTTT